MCNTVYQPGRKVSSAEEHQAEGASGDGRNQPGKATQKSVRNPAA